MCHPLIHPWVLTCLHVRVLLMLCLLLLPSASCPRTALALLFSASAAHAYVSPLHSNCWSDTVHNEENGCFSFWLLAACFGATLGRIWCGLTLVVSCPRFGFQPLHAQLLGRCEAYAALFSGCLRSQYCGSGGSILDKPCRLRPK